MTKVKIVSNIPIPKLDKRTLSKGAPVIYPWAKMKVRDSFPVPPDVVINNFRRQAWDAGRKYKRKFSVLKFEGWYRCWRVK